MKEKLTVLWTNADPITAELMVFMYTSNALRLEWWEEVEIIVWGAPTKLVAEDEKIERSLKEVIESGVKVRFCTACAQGLGVYEQIEEKGFTLEYMGEALTDALKGEGKVLTV